MKEIFKDMGGGDAKVANKEDLEVMKNCMGAKLKKNEKELRGLGGQAEIYESWVIKDHGGKHYRAP